MAPEFDPYLKWLGVRSSERPPNHYALLGISLFENDPEAIANAADRQMSHVRTYQSGKHSALSQQILNELASARVCLLNPARKAAYDASLQEADESGAAAVDVMRDDDVSISAGLPVAPADQVLIYSPAPELPPMKTVALEDESLFDCLTPTARPPLEGFLLTPLEVSAPLPEEVVVTSPSAPRDSFDDIDRLPSAGMLLNRRRRRQTAMPAVVLVLSIVLISSLILIAVVNQPRPAGPPVPPSATESPRLK